MGDAETDTVARVGATIVVAVPAWMAFRLLLLLVLSEGRTRLFPLDSRGGTRWGERVLEGGESSSNPTGRGLLLLVVMVIVVVLVRVV